VALASALCCAGLAQAQTESSVTLYGLADVGITSVSGLKAGTVTQVASGIMEGSRWGIKGTEDMGGGYKAIFTLEARVELDTGGNSTTPISSPQLSDRLSKPAALGLPQAIIDKVEPLIAGQWGVNLAKATFDRQAFVGLITPFGAVLAGRMYTPAFETNAAYDIMATQSGLAAGQIIAFPAALEIRKSNALAYRFVKDGLSGSFMYALGEANVASKSRMLGMNGNYKTGDFSVGFGYNTANNELGEKSLTTSVLGASMNLGGDTVSTMVAKLTDDHPTGFSLIGPAVAFGLLTASPAIPGMTPAIATATGTAAQNAYITAFRVDGTLFHIGYRHMMGAHSIAFAYNRYNDQRASDADVASYGVAYTHALSKRTDLNAILVRYDNGDRGQVAPGGNGYIGGVTKSAGTDSTGLAFGIRHRF
jgi:predicted porin